MGVFRRSKSCLPNSGLAVRFDLGLGFGFLLARAATFDGDDIVLYGGDRSPYTRPHTYREPPLHGFSYLLLVLDHFALRDKRFGGLQVTSAIPAA